MVSGQDVFFLVYAYESKYSMEFWNRGYSESSQTSKMEFFAKVVNVCKCQSHKMVKHTQTIRRQIADELFECVWLFCEIGA